MFSTKFLLSAVLLAATPFIPNCEEPETPTPAATPIPVDECIVTGCSGQICASEDMPTTCEWTCEYGCYQYAECEVQVEGACGWTGNDEFDACLRECGVQ